MKECCLIDLLAIFLPRRILAATVRLNKTGQFLWVGSDSWGAKLHPVRDQEFAAEGAITILPKRSSLTGIPPLLPTRLLDIYEPIMRRRPCGADRRSIMRKSSTTNLLCRSPTHTMKDAIEYIYIRLSLFLYSDEKEYSRLLVNTINECFN